MFRKFPLPGWIRIGTFVVLGVAERLDYLYLLDPTGIAKRAVGYAIPAGILSDLGVALLLETLRRVVRHKGLAAFLVVLQSAFLFFGAINFVTLATIGTPADPLMFTYVGDVLRGRALESPVPLSALFVHGAALVAPWLLVVFAASRLERTSSEAPLPPRHAWPSLPLAAVAFLGTSLFAQFDMRADSTAYGDGMNWMVRSARGMFRPSKDADLRRLLIVDAVARHDLAFSSKYPLARGPMYRLCAEKLPGCLPDADEDKDGIVASKDCDDHDASVFPGAPEREEDGIDQDCDGADGVLPNVLYIQLEGMPARILAATNTGEGEVARELAALIQRPDARVFTRFETSGTQTARGFVSAYCSLVDRFGQMLSRNSPDVGIRCFPEVFREQGYQTQFVQNSDETFDLQGLFASRAGFSKTEGYRDIAAKTGVPVPIAKWGLDDKQLFERLLQIIDEQKVGDPPLLLGAQTIVNHHPYVVPDPQWIKFPAEGTIWDKVRNTSGYVDHLLGDFLRTIERINNTPGPRPFVVVLSGDHGHATGLHPGNTLPASGLYAENVHTPLVFWSPGHPARLARMTEAITRAPASNIDLAPTLYGLLGMRPIHASMGRDLNVPIDPALARAYGVNVLGGGYVRVRTAEETVVAHGTPFRIEYYASSDLNELHNLFSEHREHATKLAQDAVDVTFAARALLDTNRIYPTNGKFD